jgi:hypothetical protein
MTSNQDEGTRWLARSIGWERSLERLRHSALADAATVGTPEPPALAGTPPPPPAEEPVVSLEPANGSAGAEPVGGSAVRTHGRRRSVAHRSHVHGAPVSW